MDLGLKGKTALVLASSKGLGKAIASQFAQEGTKVMVTSRNEEQLKKTVEEIQKETDTEISYRVCDVTKAASVKDLVKQTVELYGDIDILINNTGGPPSGKFDDFNDEDWENAFQLTLLSYIRAIREVLPHMRRKGSGRILNIASSSFKEPIDGLTLSNTFRTGVVGLAKSLSVELGPGQILINTLGPGRIQTERLDELESARAQNLGISREEIKQNVEKSIPLGRYGTPDELAKMAVFLCSEVNTYITGQAFLVDGGKTKAL